MYRKWISYIWRCLLDAMLEHRSDFLYSGNAGFCLNLQIAFLKLRPYILGSLLGGFHFSCEDWSHTWWWWLGFSVCAHVKIWARHVRTWVERFTCHHYVFHHLSTLSSTTLPIIVLSLPAVEHWYLSEMVMWNSCWADVSELFSVGLHNACIFVIDI